MIESIPPPIIQWNGRPMAQAILLLFFGIFLVAIPIHDYCTTPSTKEIRQERAYIASWPAVAGQLDVVHLVEDRSAPPRKTTWYHAEVEYRYQVDGKEYKGERLTLRTYGLSPYRKPYFSELQKNMSRFISGTSYVKKESVDPGLTANLRTSYYLSNRPIAVHYDPQRPEFSILDTFDYDPPSLTKSLLFSMAFVIPGGLFIVMSFFLWRHIAARRVTDGFAPVDVKRHLYGRNRCFHGRDRDTAPQPIPEQPKEEFGHPAGESGSLPHMKKPRHPKEGSIPNIDRTGCACPRLPMKYRNGFPTEWDYQQIEALLIAELNAGNMSRLKDPDFDTPFFNDYFECKHCGKRWKLSRPDQAYRGELQIMEDRTSSGKKGRL